MHPTAISNGLAIYQVGEGEPIMLFPYPHATTVSSIAESPIIEILVQLERSVVTFDPPGAYASSRPGDCTLKEMLTCAIETLNYFGIEEPIDTIGHSMGAFCALAFALDNPKRVNRLVLIGALSGFPAVMRWGIPHNWRWWRDREWWQVSWLGARIMLGLGNLAVHKKLSNEVEKASFVDKSLAPHWTIQPGDRNRPAPFRVAWQRNVLRYDLTDQLSTLNIPVLLLFGHHDPQTPIQIAQQLRSLLPDTRLVVFENSGHSPFVEEPEKFSHAVSEFLAPCGNK